MPGAGAESGGVRGVEAGVYPAAGASCLLHPKSRWAVALPFDVVSNAKHSGSGVKSGGLLQA